MVFICDEMFFDIMYFITCHVLFDDITVEVVYLAHSRHRRLP